MFYGYLFLVLQVRQKGALQRATKSDRNRIELNSYSIPLRVVIPKNFPGYTNGLFQSFFEARGNHTSPIF